jgi:dihydroorotase/N-acyl-D-amino-acid deacylase
LALLGLVSASAEDFDLLIRGGAVIRDGSSEPERADVGIVGDRIAAIGDLDGQSAAETIDATGMLVVPGFIDTHSHGDRGGPMLADLRQGITTTVVGNCGRSPRPDEMTAHWASIEPELGPNHAPLVGHNTLRRAVDLSGPEPTPEQMEAMRTLLGDAMRAGAFGMSTGLTYSSGYNSSTEEIIELAEVVAVHGGVYATHMRNEGPDVLKSVDETLTIARSAGCRAQISHAKCLGPDAWDLADTFVSRVEAAHAAGVDVMFDQYPYAASQTGISALFPTWARDDWESATRDRREELEAETAVLLAGRGGAGRVYLTRGEFRGRLLSDIAAERAKNPIHVLIDDIGAGGASAVYHSMQEEDLLRFMASPLQMIGTDGPTDTHPRGHGAFPRFWARYVRDAGICTPTEAVLRTSTRAAHHFRLDELQRGALQEGYFADVVVLDLEGVQDRATFDEPTLSPTGVPWVIVNGRPAIRNGEPGEPGTGRVLKLTEGDAN